MSGGTIRAGLTAELARSTDIGAGPSGKPVAPPRRRCEPRDRRQRARPPHLRPYVKTGHRRLRGASRIAATRFMEAVMANTREHRYTVSLTWTGNLGSGTSGYRDYARDYEIGAEGKPVIHGSADATFRGDRSRWNPDELLLASLSACHKLWYRRRSWDHRDRLRQSCRGGAGGRARRRRPVQECGAAPERDRGSRQRCRQSTRSPPTRAREVLHCEFSCRVRAGDRLGRLSGGRGHRGDKSWRSEKGVAPGMEKRSPTPLCTQGSRTAARPSSVERGPNFGPKRASRRRN